MTLGVWGAISYGDENKGSERASRLSLPEETMKQAEYVGEVLADGDLSLPESVRNALDLRPAARVKVMISVPDTDPEEVKAAWTLFQQMGRDAAPGQLPDAAVRHGSVNRTRFRLNSWSIVIDAYSPH